jgi:hypothetical protein
MVQGAAGNNKGYSENSKKDYPKSVLRLEEKIFLQGFCYFINNIPIFI